MVSYSRLDPQRSEIRLLTIHPGERDAEMRCSLQVVSLLEPGDFEALSYVWGAPADPESIIVDGAPLGVTPNLAAALRGLRHPRQARVMWIDAVCINQKDVGEKNFQVPLMSKIYLGAASVVVWLGEANPNLERACSWAQTYIKKEITPASSYWLGLSSISSPSLSDLREKELSLMRAQAGYMDFVTNPYWTRMWTFQEFRLSHNEPVCTCGQLTFHASLFEDMSAFRSAVKEAQDNRAAMEVRDMPVIEEAGHQSEGSGSEPPYLGLTVGSQEEDAELAALNRKVADSLRALRAAEVNLNSANAMALVNETAKISAYIHAMQGHGEEVKKLRNHVREKLGREQEMELAAGRARPTKIGTFSPSQVEELRLDLMAAIDSTRARECYDPRDKIFAVYGISQDIQEAYPPDYTKPVLQVMHETTAFLLNNTKRWYSALQGCAPRPGRFASATYPSWVINFTQQSHSLRKEQVIFSGATAKSLRDAASAASPINRLDADIRTLQIAARSLGDCFVLGRFDPDNRKVPVQLANLFRTFAEHDPSGACSLKAARACLTLLSSSRERTNAQLFEKLSRKFGEWDWAKPMAEDGKEVEDRDFTFIPAISKELAGKAFVVSARGPYGICGGDVQDGDLVAVPPEFYQPVVLRKEQAAYPVAGGPYYQWVGLAIFEGVMEDGGIDPALVAQLGQESPITFRIH